MRVLLTHKFYNHTGGAEVFFHEVGRVLKENGNEVAYYSTNNDGKYEEDGNLVYWAEDVNYNSGNIINRLTSLPKLIYSKENKKTFRKALEEFKPDIVHAFAIYITITPSILEVCKEMGIPVVMSCNDYKVICPNYKLYHHGKICEDCKGGKFINAVKNKCCKESMLFSVASAAEAYVHESKNIYRQNVDCFLFASEFMAGKVAEFWGRDKFKYRILKNPFESQKFPLSIENEDYILYFGRLIDEKGVDVLIKAMEEIPNIKLKIVGDGPYMDIYKKMAQGSNNVEFLGAMWGEELDEVLSKTKFVVVPSIWHENYPYVIIQSFALGKPVIGSNRGGIPEMIENNERGMIYEALDPKDLSDKINLLWEQPQKIEKMGRAAKKWSDEQFNDKKFYSDIISIYKEVRSWK